MVYVSQLVSHVVRFIFILSYFVLYYLTQYAFAPNNILNQKFSDSKSFGPNNFSGPYFFPLTFFETQNDYTLTFWVQNLTGQIWLEILDITKMYLRMEFGSGVG